MKSVVWQGSSYEDVLKFPADARREAGFQLDKVQRGQDPDNWKPMNTIGPGVREIRIDGTDGKFRVVYVANIGDRIFVLHAFQKKTGKTRHVDLQLARARLKAVKRNEP